MTAVWYALRLLVGMVVAFWIGSQGKLAYLWWSRGLYQADVVVPDGVIREGYQLATACLGEAPVPLSDIRFYVVPRKVLRSSPVRDGKQDYVLGITLPGRRVYLAQSVAREPWAWAHEIVHAEGTLGHPAVIFERCGLT